MKPSNPSSSAAHASTTNATTTAPEQAAVRAQPQATNLASNLATNLASNLATKMSASPAALAPAPRAHAPSTNGAARPSLASPASSTRGQIAPHAIKVLCVDDHAVLIEGLRAQFGITGRLTIVGSLPSAARLVDEVRRLEPDVVLLDVEMPGPDAFETADRLHRAFPRVRTIVLSAHVRDSYISAGHAAGVSGYFSKGEELSEIVEGIIAVVQSRPGSMTLGRKVSERCRPAVQGASQNGGGQHAGTGDAPAAPKTMVSSLSKREAEVLRLIGKGLSRSQIAVQLSRSVKTIDGHQERMMRKLEITTRSDLMRLAIREGFAEA